MKKVIAVVVTYNRKELLKECIEALINQDYKNCEILIVDNASTDGTKEFIEKYIKDSKIIYKNTGSNLGGAGGFNYGIRKACELGCDFVWVMDDDCIVKKDTLTKLLYIDKSLNGNYGFLASKVLWTDETLCKMNIPKKTFGTWLKEFNNPIEEVAMASFVSLFLKKEVIMELGLPIKEFFIWTDDWEYTRRISRRYKCYYITNSVVTHKCKNNVGASIAEVDERLERFNNLYRNDVFLYRREGIKGWILLYLRLCKHKLAILKSDKKDKKARFKIINNAIKEGKKFKPSIEKLELNETKRVLEIFGEPLSNGGQEAFIMNMYRNIDKSKIQFDFFTPFYCDNEKMKSEIESYGGKLFTSNGNFKNGGNKKDLMKNVKAFLSNHYYDIVHIHSGSTYALMYISKIARKSGIPNVIVHSHCGGFKNLKYRVIKFISTPYLLKYPTQYCACSKLAAEWKFPKSIIQKNNYTILKNAIDTDKFYYSEEIRNSKRKELNIENKFVVGHIGRFSIQKNHEFVIDVFNKILNKKENAVLLLIGIGELQEEIKEKVKNMKLENNVFFLNIRQDINELLNAMDIFLLPSFFEGLPVVGIEAEATGLPVYTSNKVTKELPLQDLTKYYKLEDGSEKWAENILDDYKNKTRKNTTDRIIRAEYDVKISAKNMEEFYFKL